MVELRVGDTRVLPDQGRCPIPPAKLPPKPTRPPDDLFADLDDAEADRRIIQYGVDGIGPSPLPSQAIGMPFSSAKFKDAGDNRVRAVTVHDLKVPVGYVGKDVFVTVTAMDRGDKDAFSNVVVDVPGTRPAKLAENDASAPGNPFLISGGIRRSNTDPQTIVLRTQSNFGPGATVPVTIYAEDTRGFTGLIEVHCLATDEAMNKWRFDTLQKITAAYYARLAEWEAREHLASYDASRPKGAIDIDVLCRHVCISSLLGIWPAASDR